MTYDDWKLATPPEYEADEGEDDMDLARRAEEDAHLTHYKGNEDRVRVCLAAWLQYRTDADKARVAETAGYLLDATYRADGHDGYARIVDRLRHCKDIPVGEIIQLCDAVHGVIYERRR